MEKIFGTSQRQDGLMQVSRRRWTLFYGYGEDAEGHGYEWRHTFDHKPTKDEVKAVIVAQINANTDEKILGGFVWNDVSVYLSNENQNNFKTAYDLAVQTEGATLPVKFKLGEDADGNAVYHTFAELSEFADFYTKAVAFIQSALQEGWEEKDALDLTAYE